MATIFVIAARLMGRPTFAPAGLFTAAIVMTIVNPHILWDVGFQLSFAATLGLMLFVGPMSGWTSARLRPKIGSSNARKVTGMFSEILFATMAAILLTLPIILYHFEQLSIVSPLANLFVLPAQPGVMVWGGLATLTGMVVPALGQLIAWVAWLFLAYTIGLVRLFASFPNAAVPISLEPGGVVAFYTVILGATWFVFQNSERRADFAGRLRGSLSWTATLFGLVIVAVLVNFWAFSQPDGDLHIAFLDVGQGDATFIQTPSGRQILIDGGAYYSVLKDQLGQQIPFWDKDIDLVIASHPDADHVAALPDVFDRYDVGRLITNGQTSGTSSFETLLSISQESGTPLHAAQAGEVIEIDDGVRLEILNPSDPSSTKLSQPTTSDQSDNERSIALRITYGDFSLLLTGDAGAETEIKILAGGRPLSAVVYKAGHHGARSSSSKHFLEKIQPQYVVISAGEGNRFGHPHEEVLERAAEVGAAVLRTDELGTIEITTDGKELWWQTR
jgi:competence protein ComEC